MHGRGWEGGIGKKRVFGGVSLKGLRRGAKGNLAPEAFYQSSGRDPPLKVKEKNLKNATEEIFGPSSAPKEKVTTYNQTRFTLAEKYSGRHSGSK